MSLCPAFALAPEALTVLDLIATASLACTDLPELLTRGVTPETLSDLTAHRWLERWVYTDRIEERVVTTYTLTPEAAERCWLELIECGVSERPRWGRCMIPVKVVEAGGRPPVQLPSWERLKSAEDEDVVQIQAVIRPRFLGLGSKDDQVPDRAPGPVEEVLTCEARDETGRLKVDPTTGAVMREEVLVLGKKVRIDRRLGKGKRDKR